jgi:ribonuclease Z
MITTTIKSRADEDICLMLNFENHAFSYLCDCGVASDLTVKDCRDTAAIFVSHTHIDHFINFDGIMRHQLAIGRAVVVTGPCGIAKNVQAKLLSFSWNLLSYDDNAVRYEVREIDDNGNIDVYLLQTPLWQMEHIERIEKPTYIYENEWFRVSFALLYHGIYTVAYCFEEQPKIKIDNKNLPYKAGRWIQELKAAFLENKPDRQIEISAATAAQGTTAEAATTILAGELFGFLSWQAGFRTAYVIDHAATAENFAKIGALCAGVDELYIESYYGLEDKEMAEKNKHSVAAYSGKLAREIGAKKAIPVHFSRRYHEDEQRAALLKEFYDAFLGMLVSGI